MLQNKSQWLLGLLAQGVENVGCGSVQVVAAGVADEGALGSGLLAGFADQGVACMVGVDDEYVGALKFLDVEVLVFQDHPVREARADFVMPQGAAAGQTDAEAFQGLFQARRVVVGQGEGLFFDVFLGTARFPFAQGLFQGLDVAVITFLQGLVIGLGLGQFVAQPGGIVVGDGRRVVIDQADDAQAQGDLTGRVQDACQA